ncbi:hypothetical protein SAICODRAFT_4738 [Saitoella complicata NRRL Y-17804]|uniref:Kinetochore protein mis14 n=1 Tax=Saitoella complicata (strain BCRC 22490 / CBS 7301 / JCM 7358 / NBRC 10748 / NRRL Y-17804) TaxID=698492 RepID=A0A0E9NAN2_SAICN|nr:uncharacterized protein SAICODRAFT_4738 [Saitoella complicata NRRL Y-17804]ODQ56559.1 hypothetical protein SAICODRAFT_4738 [Saitoella complicata NRRL Y-17804]GAO46465.1 hypothetical protein G7K_0696-t1 [Saitoella complicata NRRL Y-17804]
MSSLQPKIPLDDAADIRYLRANLTKAVRDKLATHLPKDNATDHEDALRSRVEELVGEFVARTFGMAKSSVTINGMDASDDKTLDPDTGADHFEPYDPSLHTRVQKLQEQLEVETLKVTQLRRDAPRRAAEAQRAALSALEAETEVNGDDEVAMEEDVTLEALAREEDVKHDYEEAMQTLKELKKSIPMTTAKLERAKDVIAYLEKKKAQA